MRGYAPPASLLPGPLEAKGTRHTDHRSLQGRGWWGVRVGSLMTDLAVRWLATPGSCVRWLVSEQLARPTQMPATDCG